MNKYELYKKALNGDAKALRVAKMLFPTKGMHTIDEALGQLIRRNGGEIGTVAMSVAMYAATRRMTDGKAEVRTIHAWFQGKVTSAYKCYLPSYTSKDGLWSVAVSGRNVALWRYEKSVLKRERGKMIKTREKPVEVYCWATTPSAIIYANAGRQLEPEDAQKTLAVAIPLLEEAGLLKTVLSNMMS